MGGVGRDVHELHQECGIAVWVSWLSRSDSLSDKACREMIGAELNPTFLLLHKGYRRALQSEDNYRYVPPQNTKQQLFVSKR